MTSCIPCRRGGSCGRCCVTRVICRSIVAASVGSKVTTVNPSAYRRVNPANSVPVAPATSVVWTMGGGLRGSNGGRCCGSWIYVIVAAAIGGVITIVSINAIVI